MMPHRLRIPGRRRHASQARDSTAAMSSGTGQSSPASPASRSRSPDSNRSVASLPLGDRGTGSPADAQGGLPAFLRTTRAEIQAKFHDLDLLQADRLNQSKEDPDPASPWAQDKSPEARARDRYANVQPWANRRIRLRVPEGRCDYINASPIMLCGSKTGQTKQYIATQGPKEAHHVWHMIWHETSEVAVVVMLTQTHEAGREKCFQYFPADLDSEPMQVEDHEVFSEDFKGTLKLLDIYEDAASRTTVRQLALSVGEETKTVWHLLFSGWPDFGVPEGEDRQALLELLKLSKDKNASPESPLIVHCSAGVGRTGTFITLDHLLEEIEEGALDDAPDSVDPVLDTVNHLREQRPAMVQTDGQFAFIYSMLKAKWITKHSGTL